MVKLALPTVNEETAARCGQTDFERMAEEASGGENLVLDKVTLPCAELGQTSWKRCLFAGCRLPGARAVRSHYTDVIFRNCDLSNADFSDAVFSRVRFEGCKLTGAKFYAAGCNNLLLVNTVCDMSSFTECAAAGLVFDRCNLAAARLDNITGKNYTFAECKLLGANFTGTPLRGCNLSSCDIEGVIVGEREIRGAKISALQAVQLAQLLGVVIVN